MDAGSQSSRLAESAFEYSMDFSGCLDQRKASALLSRQLEIFLSR